MEFKCCTKSSQDEKKISMIHDFLKAVSDANRLKIICILKGGPKCVCEIFPVVGISQKLASHHLKQLKKIGLLTENREGNFIRYSLNKKSIKKYKNFFNQVIK